MMSAIKEKIRFPVFAGQFYPQEKRDLGKMINNFLEKATFSDIKGEVFGLILPHAGYVFSGQVAAFGYKAIAGKKIETVILMGDSHCERFNGVSVWEKGKWQTPLGEVIVDEKLAQKIISQSKRFFVRDSAHLFEHSLEVHLPFLQTVLKKFKILPLIFGSENEDWKILAKTILATMKEKKILIIASSDLSHYPFYDLALEADKRTIEAILRLDAKIFSQEMELLNKDFPDVATFACAQDSIKTIIEIAKNKKAKLLKYQNSGDTIYGNKKEVVGYASICFFN